MPTKTNKMLLGTLVVALIAGTLWWATRPTPVKSASAAPVPVRVVQVVSQDVPRYVTGIGAVLSLHSVMIRPQIDGILTQLLVKEGQTVKAGELLATLDDRSIKASLNQANAQLAQNQAQLKVANIDLKRYQLLSVDNGVSRQTLDQQQALVNELKATAQGFQAAIAAAQVRCRTRKFTRRLRAASGFVASTPATFCGSVTRRGCFPSPNSTRLPWSSHYRNSGCRPCTRCSTPRSQPWSKPFSVTPAPVARRWAKAA